MYNDLRKGGPQGNGGIKKTKGAAVPPSTSANSATPVGATVPPSQPPRVTGPQGVAGSGDVGQPYRGNTIKKVHISFICIT